MARRSAPPNSGPSYLPPSYGTPGRQAVDPNESRFQRFLREQVRLKTPLSPESVFSLMLISQVFSIDKLPGNLNILTSSLLFFGGIAVMRTFGESMVADI